MKKLLSMALVAVMGLTMIGCAGDTVQEDMPMEPEAEIGVEEDKVEDPLRLGLIGALSAVPIVLADQNGYFEENGVDVNVEVFSSAADRDAALQAGELDGVICDQVAIAIYQNSGIDMKIASVTDGAFILVAGKDTEIEEVSDLVGKTVGISERTSIEYTLDELLKQNGVAVEDVEKVAIPPMPTRLEMLMSGEIDAAVMPNPFSDTAIADGAREIGRLDTDTGGYISVVAFHGDVIEERPEDLVAFAKGYNQAVQYMNTTAIEEYEDIIIDVANYPEDMRGNINLHTYREVILPPVEEVEGVYEWAAENGLLTKELTFEETTYEINLED